MTASYPVPEWTAMITAEDMPEILREYRQWWNRESPHASAALRARGEIVDAVVTHPDHVGILIGMVADLHRDQQR